MDNRDELKILVFLCNWGPHAAFQALQDAGNPVLSRLRMVRVPCSGRMTKALMFKPFEMGADGVVLLGCGEGSCRYGVGTSTARNNVEDTREILDMLGLSGERLAHAHFREEESEGMLAFLADFLARVEGLGKSPIRPHPVAEAAAEPAERIREIVKAHDVFACQDCGKCTSACSLTLAGKPFSPRAMASSLISGDFESEAVTKGIWACLTCGLCYDRCPSAVNFPEFVREVRAVLYDAGLKGVTAHDGFFQSLSRAMTSKDLGFKRWDWLSPDLSLDPSGKTLFFGGCAPFFDVFFRHSLKVNTRKILEDSIRLMNFFDIKPMVLENERCCGHDLLVSGDRENFLALARQNAAAINDSGAEEVVVACPEGYRALTQDYPREGAPINIPVTHILDLVERNVAKGAVAFKSKGQKFTFQDPCRLSRHAGLSALPRQLLARFGRSALKEMPRKGTGAVCCGNSAWTGCDGFSKALQVERLKEARSTGASLLVTACPKCQIHLACAMNDPFMKKDLEMEMEDITCLLSKTIYWE